MCSLPPPRPAVLPVDRASVLAPVILSGHSWSRFAACSIPFVAPGGSQSGGPDCPFLGGLSRPSQAA